MPLSSVTARARAAFAPALAALLLALAPTPAQAQGAGEKLDDAARDTEQAVRDAGRSAADKVEHLWLRIDESRLKNRTRDEIVAWLIMGCLVGSLAVNLGLCRPTLGGRLFALGAGLVGAFVGGVVVHVAGIDFGMGPVLIRYEDLAFAAAGALVLLLAERFLARRRARSNR